MKTTTRGSASLWRFAIVAVVVTACHRPSAASADPITISHNGRATQICDTLPADISTCPSADTPFDFSVTFDPDTMVFEQTSYSAGWRTTGPVSYTISLPTLDDPWGGPITHKGEAAVTFETFSPLSTSRQAGVHIIDGDVQHGCSADGKCERSWVTSFEWFVDTQGPPGLPTPDDFLSMMLLSPAGARSPVIFQTAASYVPLGENTRTYVPGSRVYFGRVPEPGSLVLLAAALAAFGTRRLTRRRA